MADAAVPRPAQSETAQSEVTGGEVTGARPEELPDRGAGGTWRGIDELARVVGAYCWVENRLFALTGAWASVPDGKPDTKPDNTEAAPSGAPALEPELRVFCAALSGRHGSLAARWRDRLPVRAGVDADALVRAPDPRFEAALACLDEAPAASGLVAVLEAVLPRVRAVYGAHLRGASAVSEGPVLEVLVHAHLTLGGEIRGGGALLERLPAPVRGVAPLAQECERAFDWADVFPAVRPS